MTIQERITESEQRFEQVKASRESHLKAAEDDLTEMTKLQGEWRVLQELLKEEKPKKPNKHATVIDAVPEEVK